MKKKLKPASKRSSAVLANLLEDITPLEKAKVEQKMLLAARIGDHIQEKGWGKKEFAEKLGKNPSEITKWLSGTHNFTTDILTEIAYELQVTVQELYAPKQVQVIYKMHAQVTREAEPLPDFLRYACGYNRAIICAPDSKKSQGTTYMQVASTI